MPKLCGTRFQIKLMEYVYLKNSISLDIETGEKNVLLMNKGTLVLSTYLREYTINSLDI